MNLNGVIVRMQAVNEQQLYSSLAAPKVEPTEEQLSTWRALEQHAQGRGVRSFPASPALVADFLNTVPDEALEAACTAIQTVHDSVGASNPVATHAVRTILERRLRIEAPQSWSKADRLVWAGLPPEIRSIVLRRERERDNALRRGQDGIAAERRKIAAEMKRLKSEEKAEDGLHQEQRQEHGRQVDGEG